MGFHLLQYFNRLSNYSMTGEQIPAPSSPRDGENVSITLGRTKVYYLTALFAFLKINSNIR